MNHEMAGQLIPPPPIIRERLAVVTKEADLLRSLLKLAIKADRENASRPPSTPLQICRAAGGAR